MLFATRELVFKKTIRKHYFTTKHTSTRTPTYIRVGVRGEMMFVGGLLKHADTYATINITDREYDSRYLRTQTKGHLYLFHGLAPCTQRA